MAKGRKTERAPSDDELDDEMEPPSIDPYAVLGLETEATPDEVKKAYRKLALRHHPDKALEEDKTAANKQFQEIAFAYAVLSDEKRRKRYDLTGSTSEVLHADDDFDWLKFYRERFAELVTEENIKKTKASYKGSAEERADLLNTYTKFRGRFNAIYQCVMLSDILEDDDRFRQILDEEIAKGTIQSYPEYERENNDESREKAKAAERKRQADFDKRQKKEAKNGKAKSKKSDEGDMTSLMAMIQQKQKSRNGGNFLDQLEAKYAPKGRGKKRATPDEPPEELFLAAEQRAKKARQSRPKKAKVTDEDDLDAMLEEEDLEDSDEEEEEEEEVAPPPKKRGRLLRGRAKA